MLLKALVKDCRNVISAFNGTTVETNLFDGGWQSYSYTWNDEKKKSFWFDFMSRGVRNKWSRSRTNNTNGHFTVFYHEVLARKRHNFVTEEPP
jgi:hypothetical protein